MPRHEVSPPRPSNRFADPPDPHPVPFVSGPIVGRPRGADRRVKNVTGSRSSSMALPGSAVFPGCAMESLAQAAGSGCSRTPPTRAARGAVVGIDEAKSAAAVPGASSGSMFRSAQPGLACRLRGDVPLRRAPCRRGPPSPAVATLPRLPSPCRPLDTGPFSSRRARGGSIVVTRRADRRRTISTAVGSRRHHIGRGNHCTLSAPSASPPRT